jgi:hypothetical protein
MKIGVRKRSTNKEEEISKQKGDNNKTTKRRAERNGKGEEKMKRRNYKEKGKVDLIWY